MRCNSPFDTPFNRAGVDDRSNGSIGKIREVELIRKLWVENCEKAFVEILVQIQRLRINVTNNSPVRSSAPRLPNGRMVI